jgi:alkyldihydroxyacetonephosphate synthase
MPIAVVRPADAASVAKLLAFASTESIPVTPYGAGTGLMGGARTVRPGIVLDTNRLNQVDVHAGDRLVWAGAGAILGNIDAELSRYSLCLGHDPWTFPVATVGGALSTNGLGYKGGRYGGMGDQAVALEVALADGSLIRTPAVRRHSTGPDYARLFVGAEGTLGVITAAALKTYPTPECAELRAFNFDSFADGFAVIDAATALGLRPSLLDYGEEHASPWPELVERDEEPPLLYVGFEGFREEVAASLERFEKLAAEHNAQPLPQSQVQEFWDDRHVIAERFARGRRNRNARRGWLATGLARDYIHVALPASQVLPFQQHAHEATAAAGVGLLECGLWTGPECFSCVLALPDALGGISRLSNFMDDLLREVQGRGGSMEYVHGAGLRLAHLMAEEHGVGLELLKKLKRALDPSGILNPGKLGFD